MNKKAVIICILLFFIVISGIIYLSGFNKVDSNVPSINSNLKSGDNSYNNAIDEINNNSYSSAQQKCTDALNFFNKSKESTIDALNIAKEQNDTIFQQYLSYTLSEINTKIDATTELKNGINSIESGNVNQALSYFENSTKLMQNAKQYSNQRSQIEQQNPSKFKEE